MEAFRPMKSPLSDRILGSFSSSETLLPTANSNGDGGGGEDGEGGGGELYEGDVFWTWTDLSSSNHSPSLTKASVSPYTSSSSQRNFGILAALQEEGDVKKRSFIQRTVSISSMTSILSSSSSSSSSARIVIPKSKVLGNRVIERGNILRQSAPVNVPVMSNLRRQKLRELDKNDVDDEEMLPPHEIVARASANHSPMTTFSVLEGVGRTLKGRDLRRVRNAVWRQTGFLDC